MAKVDLRSLEPSELLLVLQAIFPDFGRSGVAEEVAVSEHPLHCLMQNFADYFNTINEEPSLRQHRALASFRNDAVALEDALENAVSTCFLEHLRQMKRYRALAPHLSAKAKKRARA